MGVRQRAVENMEVRSGELFDLSFYKGKKVLVTGHTGFKGSWLCRVLIKYGAAVCGYSLPAPTQPNLFALCGAEEQMRSVTGDVRDLERMQTVFREFQPEIVLHLAAQPQMCIRDRCRRRTGRERKYENGKAQHTDCHWQEDG